MNAYLAEWMARERLDEARAFAARQAAIRTFAPTRHPVRMAVGLALIKAGHWVAGRAPRRQPRRATA